MSSHVRCPNLARQALPVSYQLNIRKLPLRFEIEFVLGSFASSFIWTPYFAELLFKVIVQLMVETVG
jgi:hypothetical protein